ncbi:MAG: Hsp20/alpha crystallin family protein [Planctomycetota bacterium]|nr:Hsp20/alpha crystallin family protein [Planctomycetota bacterium]MDA1180428.1 Hsp20/alpha crystallin family protein [Planctomycetota bacterium]
MLRAINRVPRNFDALYREMDNVVQHLFGDDNLPQGFSPRANVAETPTAFEVTLELPGVTSENIHVGIEDGYLIVSGERTSEREKEGKTFHRIEHRYGAFRRAVRIPENVVEDNVEATYRDGILTIVMPKGEKEKSRRIEVKSAS